MLRPPACALLFSYSLRGESGQRTSTGGLEVSVFFLQYFGPAQRSRERLLVRVAFWMITTGQRIFRFYFRRSTQ